MHMYRFPSYCPPETAIKTSQVFPDAFKNQLNHYYDFFQDIDDSNQSQNKLDIARNSVVIPPISQQSQLHLPKFITEGLELHSKYLHLRNDEYIDAVWKDDNQSLTGISLFVVQFELSRIE